MSTSEVKKYQGNCHCGAVKFHIKSSEIKTATACNCSICSKKSYLWIFPGKENLIFERGQDTLKSYQFREKVFSHKFCPTCGTGVMATGKGIGINVRTLVDVNPFSLDIKNHDGWNHYQPQYEPPKFVGELPNFEGDDLKIYTGGCHCGAVTLAVKSKSLQEVEVKEDNCSICQRNGYVMAYPTIPQVSISGEENTTAYKFSRKFCTHHFCTTCGIPLYMRIHGPPADILESWPEARKELVRENCKLLPVNLKALNGVEWADLKVQRQDEGAVGYVVD